MKKSSSRIFFIAGILLAVAFSQLSVAASIVDRPKWREGELIVKFKDTARQVDTASFLGTLNLTSIRSFRLADASHVKLPANTNVEDMVAQLANSPLVEYAHPNYLYYTNVIPDDTFFSAMWGADNTAQTGGAFDADMDLPEAWDITTGSANVVVAVLDSGASLTHPDLADNIWVNPGEIPGNGIDDDSNGYVDDVNGWDFARNDNNPSPVGGACQGHGTHTAGTIGAVGNNATGVTGVAWNVQVMPLNTFTAFLGIFCTTADSDLLEAIDYYTKMGVRISSNSYGGGLPSVSMQNAIRRSKSIFIAAAGNEAANNDSSPSYPANYNLDNVISVAATNDNDLLAGFSNFGILSVDLGAPGEDILSTVPGGYELFNGTSMATPNVAGVAALLLSQDAGLTIREIRWRILNGVDVTGIPVATQGRANAFKSLQFGLSPPDVSVSIAPVGSSTVPAGSTITYSISLTNNTALAQTASGMVYVRAEDGRERVLAGPGNVPLAAGETVNGELVQNIPLGVPPQDFEFIISGETATSLDEDKTVFTIIP